MDVDALYARHRDALLVFLVRRTADTEVALDLWAETFAQAVAGRRRYRGTTDAEAAGWLFGIARKPARPLLPPRPRRAARAAQARAGAARGRRRADAEMEERAGLESVRRDLARRSASLSEPVRDAVQLRIVDELSYADVARSLQISEPAARARVSRGLAARCPTSSRRRPPHDPRSLYGRLRHDLARAGRARARRRRRVVALALPGGRAGGDRRRAGSRAEGDVDAVAAAREALAPTDEIVHMKVRMKCPRTISARRSSSGTRAIRRAGGRASPCDAAGTPRAGGDAEMAYRTIACGCTTSAVTSCRSGERRCRPMSPSILGGDPSTDLRAMLAQGDVRDDGVVTVDGRVGAPARQRAEGLGRRLVYYMDPQTFAPVGGHFSLLRPGGKYSRGPSFTVTLYERLPFDARLLEFEKTPATRYVWR